MYTAPCECERGIQGRIEVSAVVVESDQTGRNKAKREGKEEEEGGSSDET